MYIYDNAYYGVEVQTSNSMYAVAEFTWASVLQVWANVKVVGLESHIALTTIFIVLASETKYTRLSQSTVSIDWKRSYDSKPPSICRKHFWCDPYRERTFC